MDAQEALRALAFNKLHVFLGVAPLSEQEAAAEQDVEQEAGVDSQDFEGYDGTPGHIYPTTSLPIRMRGMRMRRPAHPGARPYGPPGYWGGPYHRHHPPYGPGPYGHGPPPFPTHLGPRGPWRGPPPHMRRGGPPPFGPRGRGGHRMRGPRPNNKNRFDQNATMCAFTKKFSLQRSFHHKFAALWAFQNQPQVVEYTGRLVNLIVCNLFLMHGFQ